MERITAALATIRTWMQANAPLLVENLAPGATAIELDEAARRLGMELPPELKALWSVHHGQLAEQNGFVGHMDLLNAQGAAAEADGVEMFLEFERNNPASWKEAGVTPAELQSSWWIAFAGRGYADLLVVSGVSGRVFWCGKDAPSLQLQHTSITEWLEQYAADIAADEYAVEEGFGDYFLARRDRERERREAEEDARRERNEAHRRQTPILEQLKAALDAKNADLAREVFEDAAKRGQLDAAVEVLFSQPREPALLATSVQWVLGQLNLSKDRWALVANGARALGNSAILDQASARAR